MPTPKNVKEVEAFIGKSQLLWSIRKELAIEIVVFESIAKIVSQVELDEQLPSSI